jgi:hypothetical protein
MYRSALGPPHISDVEATSDNTAALIPIVRGEDDANGLQMPHGSAA